MPIYTFRRKDDPELEEFDVSCKYEEMLKLCEEYGFERVIKPAQFISQHESTLKKAGTEWQDKLKSIHKNAGRRSTIKL